ncbi:hypothetical protein ACHAWX_001629 [Stephanocyclus meneghinianus]
MNKSDMRRAEETQGTGMSLDLYSRPLEEQDNPPPVPVTSWSHLFEDGPKSKTKMNPSKPAVLTLTRSADNECPPLPFRIGFADDPSAEKLTGAAPAGRVKAAFPDDQPSTAEAEYFSQNEALLNPEVMQMQILPNDSSSTPDLSVSVIQETASLPNDYSGGLVQSASIESVSDEETNEEFVIPEAFLVQETAPVEVLDVGVAELVEPDPRMVTFALKKYHIIVVLAFIAVVGIVLATGLSINARGNIDTPELLQSSFLTSSKPSVLPSSRRPSVFSSSLQPSVVPTSLSIRYVIEKNVLQRNVTFDGMETTNSRFLALTWITEVDQRKLLASDSQLFQRYILVLLNFELNLSWLSNGNECEWLGVECDSNGLVIGLNLDDFGLHGMIPPEIGMLEYMQMLSMKNNSLFWTIPSELGNLRELSELILHTNQFIGTIPSEIGQLASLTVLSLYSNQFTGGIPCELGSLPQLSLLYLNSNNLNGMIPPEIEELTSLTDLDLQKNRLKGTVPSKLGNLQQLSRLSLHSNDFTGTIPSEIGELSLLTFLDISLNQFIGAVPSELGNLQELSWLYLYANNFTGALPTEIGNLQQLSVLYLYSNNFTGTIPSEIGRLTLLKNLDMSLNQFTGAVPSDIGNLQELSQLSLYSNNFTGTLPTEIGLLKSLTDLSIQSNQFVGRVPSEIGNLQQLTVLRLNHNMFTGTFPINIQNDLNLVVFCLQNNNFTEILPAKTETDYTCLD